MDAMMAPTIEKTVTVGVRVDAIPSIPAVTAAYEAAFRDGRKWIMTFANPSTAVYAKRNPALGPLLHEFDLVGPDGIGMVLAVSLLHGIECSRVSFDTTSLSPYVFEFARNMQAKIILIGGCNGVAEAAKTKIIEEYPGIQIVGAFHGYNNEQYLIDMVTQLDPDIVVVGMGTLLQDRLLVSLVRNGWSGLGFTCGGFLDQLAVKGHNYYPSWINRSNLRWLYRLLMEPRRLWRRYLLEYPTFMFGLTLALLGRG
jgi:N-acetylglucosaminyldiphosphoundecaprenol N-acetyl-beta-D-mannosaminyltransferase